MSYAEARGGFPSDPASDIGFFVVAVIIALALFIWSKIKRRNKSSSEAAKEGMTFAVVFQWWAFSSFFIGVISYTFGVAICRALSINSDWAGVLAFVLVVAYTVKTYDDWNSKK
jgi:hypothetical protein